jgi:hypothetical protein
VLSAVAIGIDSDEVLEEDSSGVTIHSTLVDSVIMNWSIVNTQYTQPYYYSPTYSIDVNEAYDGGQVADLTNGYGSISPLALATETLSSHVRTSDLVSIQNEELRRYGRYSPDIDPRLTRGNQFVAFDFPDSTNTVLGWVPGDGSTDFRLDYEQRVTMHNDLYYRFKFTCKIVVKHISIRKTLGIISSINETHESFQIEREYDRSTIRDSDQLAIVDFDSPTNVNLIELREVYNTIQTIPSANGEDWWVLYHNHTENISISIRAEPDYNEFENNYAFSKFRVSMWNYTGIYSYQEFEERFFILSLPSGFCYYRVEAIYEPIS